MDETKATQRATLKGSPLATTVCPRCGENGKPVKPITLQSLVKPEALTRAGSAAYRFCPSERCDVVYFPESDGPVFTKTDLTVRVGVKETTAPRHVCYCFNHTVEEIEEQVRLTGRTTVLDDIKTRMKEACWCETKSPLGSCCLATVTKYVKAAQVRYGGKENPVAKASPEIVTPKVEDCCVGHATGESASSGQPAHAVEDCRAAHNAEAKSEPTAAVSSSKSRASKGEKIAWIGSVGSAVIASACCWLPLLLLAVGVSGVAVSATFEKYRPLFATLTFGFLAAAFYFAYRPRPKAVAGAASQGDASCPTPAAGEACCPPVAGQRWPLQKFNRAMLWVVTAIALAFVFFPNYIGAFLGGGQRAGFGPNVDQYVVAVEGMDCAGCATALEKELRTVPGVSASKVSFEKKEAIIGVPKGDVAPKDAVLAAITDAGFTGRFESLETWTIPIAGMTCEACAVGVRAELSKVPGVRGAEVSYEGQRAVVVTDASVDSAALTKAVESAGYKVAGNGTPAEKN